MSSAIAKVITKKKKKKTRGGIVTQQRGKVAIYFVYVRSRLFYYYYYHSKLEPEETRNTQPDGFPVRLQPVSGQRHGGMTPECLI